MTCGDDDGCGEDDSTDVASETTVMVLNELVTVRRCGKKR